MVIDDIVKQYKTLSSADRELLLEVRNKIDNTITLINVLLFQLNEIGENTLKLLEDIELLDSYVKKIERR